MSEAPVIQLENVSKTFPVKGGFGVRGKSVVKAVDGVSFSIQSGETLGLVGESGCGKTTVGRTAIRLYSPAAGRVLFRGKDITALPPAALKPLRKEMQMIFQDPYASLNPRMTVGDIVGEAIVIHRLHRGAARAEALRSLLVKAGLAGEHINRYPHEFSGGQRQRVGIARALAVEPSFIMCDEPVSALDVSIQAQIVNMLEELQEELRLTYLFIAHDLSMVKHISTRIGVMYLGRLAELGGAGEVYAHPAHPYTQALISAVPVADPDAAKKSRRIVLEGNIPSPINPPTGCRFKNRCRHAKPLCAEDAPALADVGAGITRLAIFAESLMCGDIKFSGILI